MSDDFDPWYRWLGIPPDEQPPHYYRLLGLRLFEDNPDVIESAADRQMAYLRTFQGGQHAQYSQELLNQVAAAKVRLLNGQRKAEYDAWLREQISGPNASPAPPLPPTEESAFADYADVLGGTSLYGKTQRRTGKKRRQWLGFVIAILAAATAAVVLVVAAIRYNQEPPAEGTLVIQWPEDDRFRGVFELDGRKVRLPQEGTIQLRIPPGRHRVAFSRPGYEPFEQTVTIEAAVRSQVQPVWRELGPKPPEAKGSESTKTGQSPKTNSPPSAAPQKPPLEDTPTEPEKGTADSPAKSAAGRQPEVKTPSPSSPPAKPSRLSVPDEAAQEKARQTIHEVYKSELAASGRQVQMQAAAKKLLQEALALQNDPTGIYVLLEAARELAVQASDGLTAFSAIEEMGNRYQVEVVELKSQILETLAKKARSAEDHKSIAEQALSLADEAAAAGNLAFAAQLGKLATREAAKGRDKETIQHARAKAKEIDEIAAAYAQVEKAIATLAQTPQDPQANLTVGRYHCLLRGDWEAGLPMLAQGSDETLKALAKRELEHPAVPDVQAALADQWRALANKTTGLGRRKMQAQAAFWYRKALPGLTGLTKVAAEKWLKDFGHKQ